MAEAQPQGITSNAPKPLTHCQGLFFTLLHAILLIEDIDPSGGNGIMLFYLSLIDTNEEKSKFERIYEAYRNLMYYAASRILGDTRDSEDVVHQAFLKIIEILDKIPAAVCPQTHSLVVTIVERKAIDLYRSYPAVRVRSGVCRAHRPV